MAGIDRNPTCTCPTCTQRRAAGKPIWGKHVPPVVRDEDGCIMDGPRVPGYIYINEAMNAKWATIGEAYGEQGEQAQCAMWVTNPSHGDTIEDIDIIGHDDAFTTFTVRVSSPKYGPARTIVVPADHRVLVKGIPPSMVDCQGCGAVYPDGTNHRCPPITRPVYTTCARCGAEIAAREARPDETPGTVLVASCQFCRFREDWIESRRMHQRVIEDEDEGTA